MPKVEIDPLPPPAPCPGIVPPGEVWTCPCCHGLGDTADGAATFGGGGGFRVAVSDWRPPTPCRLCRGKGRVLVLPLPDEGAAP